jgi:plasmid stabilization system protein ParE
VKQRTVIWEPAARSDYYDILHFIAADNPVAALKVADRIEAAAEMLGEMAIGKAGRVFGTYEWLVTGLPYIIAYEILGLPSGSEAITILHVIHMSRDWPDGAWPET